MGTGLLVTELMGQGVNYVTGDYSRGASGYWVENGVIQYPVEEITIAGNMRDMFQNIVAIGNDQLTRGTKTTGFDFDRKYDGGRQLVFRLRLGSVFHRMRAQRWNSML